MSELTDLIIYTRTEASDYRPFLNISPGFGVDDNLVFDVISDLVDQAFFSDNPIRVALFVNSKCICGMAGQPKGVDPILEKVSDRRNVAFVGVCFVNKSDIVMPTVESLWHIYQENVVPIWNEPSDSFNGSIRRVIEIPSVDKDCEDWIKIQINHRWSINSGSVGISVLPSTNPSEESCNSSVSSTAFNIIRRTKKSRQPASGRWPYESIEEMSRNADDDRKLDELYKAGLDPNGKKGSPGRGRIADALGEHGERFVDRVFRGVMKIPTDPKMKVKTPDFISEKYDFIVEVKTGMVLPATDVEATNKTSSFVGFGIPVQISKKINGKRRLRQILRDVLQHSKSKETGYERVRKLYGLEHFPERVYAFCPMDFGTYSRFNIEDVKEILSDYDFERYGVSALVLYLEPVTFELSNECFGGDCFVYYQNANKLNKTDFIDSNISFHHVERKNE